MAHLKDDEVRNDLPWTAAKEMTGKVANFAIEHGRLVDVVRLQQTISRIINNLEIKINVELDKIKLQSY